MTLAALELVAELQAFGADVHIDGDELVIAVRGPLPDALLDRIRANKATLMLGGKVRAADFRNRLLGLCETLDDGALVARLSDQDLRDVETFWPEDEQLRTFIALQHYEPQPTSDELKAAQDAHTARWCSKAAR